jgi:hypothetical protein
MTFDAKKNSNMTLMAPIKNSKCMELDCSICYKKINKNYFVCGAPCRKVFHPGCIEKMLKQSEESAYEADEEPMFRCCYCRRDIDLDNYDLQLFAQHLIALNNYSYDVHDALKRVVFLLKNNEKPDDDEAFEYYELRDNTYVKKPKQPKREILKKRVSNPRQFRIKQNIGGRRR